MSQFKSLLIFLCSITITGGCIAQSQANDKWTEVKHVGGWSISYPPNWEPFVISGDGEEPVPIGKSENVNFSGPKDCVKKKQPCGIFRISYAYQRSENLEKFVNHFRSGFVSRQTLEVGGINSLELKYSDGNRMIEVPYRGRIIEITLEPETDATLEETFKKIISTMRFEK